MTRLADLPEINNGLIFPTDARKTLPDAPR
jgi:hypothetical protein